jgi:hypothetical protein
MAKKQDSPERPILKVPLEKARKLIQRQMEKGRAVPNASVNENDQARQWYDYTEELLLRICSTEKLSDEFTGKGGYDYSDDIRTSYFLRKLESIYMRLELFQAAELEAPKAPLMAPVLMITQVAGRFHRVARQLRHRHEDRPTLALGDEYDVQDPMHALLLLHFDDVRPEEWTPSYAGGSSRMDFLLKAEKIVLETKMTRKGLGAREVADQLIIDTARYKSHPDCKCLICLVYDPDERITNPAGIENDLTRITDDLDVRAIVAQR